MRNKDSRFVSCAQIGREDFLSTAASRVVDGIALDGWAARFLTDIGWPDACLLVFNAKNSSHSECVTNIERPKLAEHLRNTADLLDAFNLVQVSNINYEID